MLLFRFSGLLLMSTLNLHRILADPVESIDAQVTENEH